MQNCKNWWSTIPPGRRIKGGLPRLSTLALGTVLGQLGWDTRGTAAARLSHRENWTVGTDPPPWHDSCLRAAVHSGRSSPQKIRESLTAEGLVSRPWLVRLVIALIDIVRSAL
jgi:hypothetical protein